MSPHGNNSAPTLRERQKTFSHPPLMVKGLYYNVAINDKLRIKVDSKNAVAINTMMPKSTLSSNYHCLTFYSNVSLRGGTDLVATWQSRGSANRLTAIRLVFYVLTFYCHFAIKSLDLEGWAVGVAVRANRQYTANQSAGDYLKLANKTQHFCH